jgi:myxalamid-type polyketide synthase MxaE and MxaD
MHDNHQSLTEEQLRQWFVRKVAEESGVEKSLIREGEPLSRYGLTSMQAVTITGDLETVLGRRISPTLLWEHPTIDAAVRMLSDRR